MIPTRLKSEIIKTITDNFTYSKIRLEVKEYSDDKIILKSVEGAKINISLIIMYNLKFKSYHINTNVNKIGRSGVKSNEVISNVSSVIKEVVDEFNEREKLEELIHSINNPLDNDLNKDEEITEEEKDLIIERLDILVSEVQKLDVEITTISNQKLTKEEFKREIDSLKEEVKKQLNKKSILKYLIGGFSLLTADYNNAIELVNFVAGSAKEKVVEISRLLIDTFK